MLWTRFASPHADRLWQEDTSWDQLLQHIREAGPFPDKAHCPWLKMARFGKETTARGSLRHDANVLEVFGFEGDYDDEQMSMEEARSLLEKHQVRAAIYPSPSWTADKPRWRVIGPFSKGYSPEHRRRFLARVNGILGGVLAHESFTLSQSYYYGRLNGHSKDYAVLVTFDDSGDGFCIDELDDLDAIAIAPKPGQTADIHPVTNLEKPTTAQWQTIQALPKFRDTWNNARVDLQDQSPSAYDMALANLAVEADWPDACIVYLLWKWRNRHGLETDKLQRQSYIARTIAKARAKEQPWPDPLKPKHHANPFDWVEEFTLTDEEAEQLENPEWAYENLIISGHVIVLCGESGAGKTTIMMWVSGELVAAGFNVLYVNADTSGGDAKSLKQQADSAGFKLLLPDLKVGKSMADVVACLSGLAAADHRLDDTVLIFDTLKKMTDVINKQQAKELYKLFRRLSGMGATLVCNAHTNKYKGEDGLPIYEGTGDLRSDVDELIYLLPDKREDGSILVSTKPDKVRGNFEPITFYIGRDRTVRRHNYVDVAGQQTLSRKLDADADIIQRIVDFLRGGQRTQSEIVEHCHGHKISRRQARRVLKDYGSVTSPRRCWITERGFERNAWFYRLPESE